MSDRWLKGVIYNDRLSPKDIEIKELRKDIERLNKGYCPIKEKCNKGECDCTNEEYNQMCEENIKLDLEIERLNNIINELEKYCIEEIEDYSKEIKSRYITDNTRGQYEGEKVCFEDILDRLQELKGSNKE